MRSSNDREAIAQAYDELEAAQDKVAVLSYAALTSPELRDMLLRRERLYRCQPAVDHRLINQLTQQTTPQELGGTSWVNVLSTVLGISPTEARRRLAEAEDLGPRTAISGEPLEPLLPTTAEAQAAGTINSEHVKVIRSFFANLPDAVDVDTRSQAEAQLACIATGLGPTQLRQAADRLAYLLNQDGNAPTDGEQARRRHLTLGKQGVDGMSELHGLLDPEARATLDAVLAKWAAPGMCNPDDDEPCVDGDPTEPAKQTDLRSQAQSNHDALKAGYKKSHCCAVVTNCRTEGSRGRKHRPGRPLGFSDGRSADVARAARRTDCPPAGARPRRRRSGRAAGAARTASCLGSH